MKFYNLSRFTVLFAIAIQFSFLPSPQKNNKTNDWTNELSLELINLQKEIEGFTLVDLEGNEYLNPDWNTLKRLAPSLMNSNRVRLTLSGKSDNNICSTEVVINNKQGKLENNYSINRCSSYGWIFYSSSDCFEIGIFHDAGAEAPYSNKVHGQVQWTFQFNQEPMMSGTYLDSGSANFFKVATPCFHKKRTPERFLSQKKLGTQLSKRQY